MQHHDAPGHDGRGRDGPGRDGPGHDGRGHDGPGCDGLGRDGPGNAIEVRDLVKRYRRAPVNAVDGIGFDVPAGVLFCLLGPNGAGKTTTVSILTTTLAPTSGRVRIAGHDLAAQRALVRREVGIVFQQPSLDLNLTAEQNIRLHAVLYGLYPWRPAYRMMPQRYRGHVRDLADVLGIAAALHRPARVLSGGMRRKLEIVRALMHQPRVLFLDEPTAGLDPQSRRSLWAYLTEARRRFRTTVFFTTHYLEEAEAADAVCVLARGRIVERGSPAEIKARQAARSLEDAYLLLLERQNQGEPGSPGAGPFRTGLARTG